ncbi:MAG: hypothetical protein KDD10_27785 [Phaeodactylibacter sp.]|nr:hypothetical protein [Phaeodactylibacter sp.]
MTMIQALRMNGNCPEGLASAGRWVPVPRAVYDCLLPFFLAWQAMDGKEN